MNIRIKSGAEIQVILYGNSTLSHFPGFFLQFSLKLHSCKNMAAAKFLLSYGNDDGAVGPAAVTALITHAVYTYVPLFRGGIDDIAAGAHAERINTPSR